MSACTQSFPQACRWFGLVGSIPLTPSAQARNSFPNPREHGVEKKVSHIWCDVERERLGTKATWKRRVTGVNVERNAGTTEKQAPTGRHDLVLQLGHAGLELQGCRQSIAKGGEPYAGETPELRHRSGPDIRRRPRWCLECTVDVAKPTRTDGQREGLSGCFDRPVGQAEGSPEHEQKSPDRLGDRLKFTQIVQQDMLVWKKAFFVVYLSQVILSKRQKGFFQTNQTNKRLEGNRKKSRAAESL